MDISAFIFGAYGAAFAVLTWLAASTLHQLRATRRRLEASEASMPPRQ